MNQETVHETNWSLLAQWEKRRHEVIRMLAACGVDPNDIPRDTPFRREGRSVFLEKYVLAENGNKLFDESTQRAVVEEIEIQPPLEVIPDWLLRD